MNTAEKRQKRLSPATLGLLVVTLVLLGVGVLSLVFAPESPPAPAGLPSGFDLQADLGALGPDPERAWAAAEKALQSGVSTLRVEVDPARDGELLADLLARAEARSGGGLHYSLEITSFPDDAAQGMVALIRAAGIAGRASVTSLDWRALQALQEIAPEIPTAYMTSEQPDRDTLQRGQPGATPWTAGFDLDDYAGSVVRLVQAAGGAVWAPDYRDLRPADLNEAQRLGLPVVAWSVDDAGDMASLIERGVAGIATAQPGRLRAVMEQQGLPLPPAFD